MEGDFIINQNIVYNVELKAYDTIVIPVCNGSWDVPEFLGDPGLIKAMLQKDNKGSKKEELRFMTIPAAGRFINLITVNLGEADKLNGHTFFQCMSNAYAKCKEIHSENILVYADYLSSYKISKDSIRMVFEAGGLTDYSFDTYKSEKSIISIKNIDYYNLGHDAEETLREAEYCISGIKLARRLINEPAVNMTPLKLAEEALEAGKENGFKVTVLEEKDIRDLDMNAFLAVGKGSDYKPVLIVMEYNGDVDSNAKIGIAGKGVTYDTGGYSLKRDSSMEHMFDDMGGAAALIGALTIISSMKLKINVVGVVAACENKVSGGSVMPGDIVRSMSGKYIEINNTDCEGRLTLADAITYMLQCHKVNKVIDIATLTESVHTALGNTIAGIFTDDETMRKATEAASRKYCEKTWELPLDEDLRTVLNSDFADIKNSAAGSTVGGYASIAALFIKEFTDNVPWVHIDIGGVSWEEEGTAWCPVGGKGFGTKLLFGIVNELTKTV